MRQCENQNSSPQGYWTLGFRPHSHPRHGHLFLLPTIAGWACQGRCISATMTTWMYSHDDASFILFLYCNVVHLGGMTMFSKQPDKVIVFFSAAILSMPSSYEAYHILPPAFLLPHTQGALRIEALDMQEACGLHIPTTRTKHITRQPIYRSVV